MVSMQLLHIWNRVGLGRVVLPRLDIDPKVSARLGPSIIAKIYNKALMCFQNHPTEQKLQVKAIQANAKAKAELSNWKTRIGNLNDVKLFS